MWHLPSPIGPTKCSRCDGASVCLFNGRNESYVEVSIWDVSRGFFRGDLSYFIGCSLWSNVSKAIINRQYVGLCWWFVAPIHCIFGVVYNCFTFKSQQQWDVGWDVHCKKKWNFKITNQSCPSLDRYMRFRSSTHQRGTNTCKTSWYTPVLLICFYGGLAFTGDILTIVETPYLYKPDKLGVLDLADRLVFGFVRPFFGSMPARNPSKWKLHPIIQFLLNPIKSK